MLPLGALLGIGEGPSVAGDVLAHQVPLLGLGQCLASRGVNVLDRAE
jgi:hypothetical protein